jgi:predicted RNase H-like HicB family nuclease
VEVPVLVEEAEGGGYRARTGEPFGIMVEGATVDDAVQKVRELIEARLAKRAQLVPMSVPAAQEHPSARFRGNWSKDDPVIQRWRQYVEEYRQKVEEDPNIP